MEINEISMLSRGGTELMLKSLHARIDPYLLQQFQIIPSRVRALDTARKRVLWLHDKPCREESAFLEQANNRALFAGIVCVSHYQALLYHLIPGVPYGDMQVLQNAIVPFDAYRPRQTQQIRLIYHSAPNRGLEILVPVFEYLATIHPDIELDVFSSFCLYGWAEKDEPYRSLFDRCMAHPRIHFHGAQPNDTVRTALSSCDIFAYPCIEPETSCIAAIEAMAAGCITVCASYGALPETTANFAHLYPFSEDRQIHGRRFSAALDDAIRSVRMRRNEDASLRMQQAAYFNTFYSWDRRAEEWNRYLSSLL
jgi:glycosyltransferase involved in cell wall biosynthesis